MERASIFVPSNTPEISWYDNWFTPPPLSAVTCILPHLSVNNGLMVQFLSSQKFRSKVLPVIDLALDRCFFSYKICSVSLFPTFFIDICSEMKVFSAT